MEAPDTGTASQGAPTHYAIDFGTSNSLLAAASAGRVWPPAPLDPLARDPTILRSILYFPNAKRCHYGQDAIDAYVEHGLEGRLLRSIKKHLAARSFNGTWIDERPMTVEDLVATMLREMKRRADAHYGVDVRRAVLGRPARFSEDARDDAFAEQRLRVAAERAGFEDVSFLPEPVAAARELSALAADAAAQPRGTLAGGDLAGGEQLVLVADYGGGTSDYTLFRMGPRPFRDDDVLAIGGVPVAGDALDASIMRHKVAAHFGADVTYRVPMGANVLRMPKPIVEELCSPARLTVLRRQDVATFLRNVRSWSLGPEDEHRLDQLRILVEDALGFSVFEVIERAKRELSDRDAAEIDYAYPGVEVHDRITRIEFDQGIEREAAAILGALDETLRTAGVAHDAVDLVCCTGGTAKVPRIAAALRERFGAGRVRDFKSFHSVVEGLALHAQARARERGA
jgi:hypothetical chaperone protein